MNYELDITRRCNLHCPGCDRLCNIVNDPTSDMTLDDVASVAEQINEIDTGQGNITVMGGEPTLNPLCLEICRYLKSSMPRMKSFSMSTNHSDNDMAGRVAALGFHVRMDDGSDDVAKVARNKVNKHCAFLMSPSELGLETVYPAGCWIRRDCGISIHKWRGSLVWNWCGAGTSLCKLLRREDLLKPSLKELLKSDYGAYMNDVCANCMYMSRSKIMAKDAPGQVSECFRQGLDCINEYVKEVCGCKKEADALLTRDCDEKRRELTVWTTYHKDSQVPEYGLAEDDHHVLFASHRDAPLRNINYMNPVWSEMVTMWYVYHNGLRSDLVGFDHYRRRISPSRMPSDGECAIFNTMALGDDTVYGQYNSHHNKCDMDIALGILDRRYGKGNPYSRHILSSHKFITNCTFIMKWQDFERLCEFMFPILMEFTQTAGCGMNVESFSAKARRDFPKETHNMVMYQRRVVSFIAERLISAYIATHLRYYK